MQKLKKALKKLAHLGKSKPAMAAKKAPPAKKKAQPVAAAKKAAPAKKPVPKKPTASHKAPAAAATKSAKSPAPKADAKDLKKKSAAPVKAAGKANDKSHEKAPAKAAPAAEKPSKKAAAPPASEGAMPAPKKAASEKSAEKPTERAPAPETAPAKAVKGKKAREDEARAAEAGGEDEEVILTDAEGRRYCRVKDCDQAATVDSYCRYHYLLFWKNIQNRKKILSEGKLERYVEELTARYPDKFLELLRKDLRSEKDFMAAIQELEIDDSGVDNEFEDEAQSYLEEVRGMSSETSNEREEDF